MSWHSEREVLPPKNGKVSRARYLVLIPVFPLLVALALVGTLPLQASAADASTAAGVVRPTPEASPTPRATNLVPQPAITADAADDKAAQKALDAIFPVPPIKIKPKPKPKPAAASFYSGGSTSSSGGSSNPCSFSNIKSTSVSNAPYSSAEKANFALINQARVDKGKKKLSWSSSHANKARAWAVHLAKNQCPLAHSPSSHWDNGENAYWVSGGSLSQLAQRAHNGFMGSSGHKDNILRSWFKVVGVGVAQGKNGSWYLIQNFGG